MPVRPSASLIIGMVAIGVVASVFGVLLWRADAEPTVAGFRFEHGTFVAPAAVALRIGGDLTDADYATVERTARATLEHAFAGLRTQFTSGAGAFWNIRVVQSLDRRRRLLPSAGESFGFGLLGGGGVVSFPNLAVNAVKYAPPGASRQQIVTAIGRGIGHAAVHEFAHQILAYRMRDDRTDEGAYEHATSDRPAQYYGDLHWLGAWPLLERKIGPARSGQ